MTDALARLSELGVSVWLDDLSRERIVSGNLAALIRARHVVGVTTNPTIFAAALAKSDAYTEKISALAARGASVEEAVFEITTEDVRTACDLFADVYTASGRLDGRVSIRSTPGWRTRPRRPSSRPACCGAPWTGRT